MNILIVLIVTSLFLYFIYSLLIKTKSVKSISSNCDTDADCPSDTKCIYNDDYKSNMCTNKKYCSIDNENLTQCDLSKDTTCDNLCNNELQFKCKQVTLDKPYSYYKDGQKYDIKMSNPGKGWCLPNMDQAKNIDCNPFLSEKILVKNTGDDSYNWGCYCKNQLFTHENTPTSQCTKQLACKSDDGSVHDIYTKNDPPVQCTGDTQCGANSKCLDVLGNKPGTFPGYCHTKWTSQANIDPFYGVCDCPPGQKTLKVKNGYNSVFKCVSDTCSPGIKNDQAINQCICPDGYIRCPQDLSMDSSDIAKACDANKEPKCILDPCRPGGNWDKETQMCKCNTTSTPDAPYGYMAMGTAENSLGSKCGKVCVDYNPCGNRGTCTVVNNNQNNFDKVKCIDCVPPYTNYNDKEQRCLTEMRASGEGCSDNNQCLSGNCKLNVSTAGIFKQACE